MCPRVLLRLLLLARGHFKGDHSEELRRQSSVAPHCRSRLLGLASSVEVQFLGMIIVRIRVAPDSRATCAEIVREGGWLYLL